MEERLPEGWVWTTLGMLGEYINGYAFNDELWSKKGRPIIRIQDLTGTRNEPNYYDGELEEKYLVRTGDFLIAWSATLGAFIWHGPEAWLNQHIFKVISYIDKLFHYYLTQSVIDDLYRKAHGSGMVHVTRGVFEATQVPLPPLPEQHRIVAAIEQHFSRIDNAVASLQHAREKAKQYRASLLRSAVEGELTKEWRAEHPVSETGEQLLTRILAERRARWEEEQLAKMREKGITPKDDKWKLKYKEPQGPDVKNLPELPEGWCWATMEQLADIIGGVTKGRDLKKRTTTTLPYLRVANVQRGFLDLDVIKTIEIPEDEVEKYLLRPGDVLLTEGGDADKLGRAAIWKGEIEKCIHQNHIFRARLIEPQIPSHWLVFCANSEQGRNYFLEAAKQTVNLASINLTQLRNCPVPLPPLAEQMQIVAEVEAGLSNIAKLEEATEHSLKKAEHDRQSILQEAFAGRLVEQDPNDEPASVLLERIREERRRREEAEKATRASRKGGRMKRAKARPTAKGENGQQETGLYKTLVEAGKPLAPDDLFKRVGLQTDEQPESVEEFYAELHTDVAGGWIKETRPDKAQVLLEALEPPPDELADEEEEEASHSSETQAAYEQHKLFEARESVAEPQPPEQRSERLRQATLWNE